jgi:hypothetical protein
MKDLDTRRNEMEQATEFPCCLHDGWDNVRLGDDGLPLVITRDNISTWFEQSEIPMPENSDGLSDAELILKFAEPLKAKSCFRVISYADALYFSSKDALEVLKGLTLKHWNHLGSPGITWDSHYPDELRKILMEFALGQTNSNETLDPVALLRQAIRDRDEEIARKKAAEEARAEAERSAAERALREQQASYEKLKDFLDSIGNFDMNGRLFSECWRPQSCDRSIKLFLAVTAIHKISLNIDDGFDANVKKIIKWMVENGAKEPELKAEAA